MTTGFLKTAVYVDGYNLYYGRLRGTAFKWLDIVTLFDGIFARRDQNERLERLHFFTAPALANFATHGDKAVEAQSAYHRALAARHADRFEIVFGKHSYDRSGTLLPTFAAGQPYDRLVRSRVWKLEEKMTDVNLALRLYRDALTARYDRIVLVSNDSDAGPALKAIRQDFPAVMIGLVTPLHPTVHGAGRPRSVSGTLTALSDWTLDHLSDEQLASAQLPAVIPTKKKAIKKPAHW